MSASVRRLPIKAVTIDLDGTLLDTIPDLAAAANGMLGELGRDPLDLPVIRTFVGKGLQKLVERTLKSDGTTTDEALTRRALEIFERHYSTLNGRHTTIYPGVVDGLDRLRARGFPLACVTNKSQRFTLPLLDRVGLAVYFKCVVAGDTLPRKKPDPAPLLHACAAMQAASQDVLMIGDSINDTQAARAAGCPVFCVTYGYDEGADVRTLDCDALIDSIEEADTLIEKA